MKTHKKFELSHIFLSFKNGKTANQISEELNISKSNLSYYTKKLKDLGVLKMRSRGVWEVKGDWSIVQKVLGTRSPSIAKKFELSKVRGHAFIWKVEFERVIDWDILLKRSNMPYKIQSNGKVKRIMFEGRKIWLNKRGDLTIYEPYDYFGRNAYESKGLAVYGLNKLLISLMKALKSRMLKYKFTTSRVHYALIKNELAKQYNDKGKKLVVKTESGTEWLWIDNSKGLNELETGNLPEDNEKVNVGIQNMMNEHKLTNFEYTANKNKRRFEDLGKDVEDLGVAIKRMSKVQIDSSMIMEQMDNNIKGLTKALFQLSEIVKYKL